MLDNWLDNGRYDRNDDGDNRFENKGRGEGGGSGSGGGRSL